MKDIEIKNYIKEKYKISKKAKIRLHSDRFEYSIRLGNNIVDLRYPLELIRDIKLENILEE